MGNNCFKMIKSNHRPGTTSACLWSSNGAPGVLEGIAKIRILLSGKMPTLALITGLRPVGSCELTSKVSTSDSDLWLAIAYGGTINLDAPKFTIKGFAELLKKRKVPPGNEEESSGRTVTLGGAESVAPLRKRSKGNEPDRDISTETTGILVMCPSLPVMVLKKVIGEAPS
jgi:hypothetical protein